MAETANPMQTQITVNHDGDTYIFKIPNQRDYMRLGSTARYYRKLDDPDGIGSEEGLDPLTAILYEATAAFVVLLERGPKWCFTENKSGEPKVNPDNFPEDAPLFDVWRAFSDELARFRTGDTGNGEPEAGETVDSKSDT